MEEDDKACPMIRMGVSGWMFLVVPAYPGSPGQKAVKRLCVCVCVLPGTVISATFWCYFTSTFVILLTIVPVYKLYLLTYLPYDTHTNTDPFNGSFSGTTWVGRYQKGKTYLDFTEARDSEWQWHQMGRMQVCTSLQTDNHASTSALSFFTGRMPFLPPNQQHQSTEGTTIWHSNLKTVEQHCDRHRAIYLYDSAWLLYTVCQQLCVLMARSHNRS